ncbi:MAG: hypothetical protein WDO70_06450 [Alphaproteobacteria bacterium]
MDQYILRRYFPARSQTYVYVSALCSVFWLAAIAIAAPDVFDVAPASALSMMLVGALYVASLFPYSAAIRDKDISAVIPVYQIIPFMTLLIGYLLFGDKVASGDILAGGIIVLGAVGCIWDYEMRAFPVRPFVLTMLGSMLVAGYMVGIHALAQGWPWYKVLFWLLTTRMVFGVGGLAGASNRQSAIRSFRASGGRVIGLCVFEQGFSVAAQASLVVAMASAPSAFHVNLCSGLQPLFGLLGGIMLGHILPRHFNKAKADRTLAARSIGIACIFGGLFLLLRP